jgi:hypothetical protein
VPHSAQRYSGPGKKTKKSCRPGSGPGRRQGFLDKKAEKKHSSKFVGIAKPRKKYGHARKGLVFQEKEKRLALFSLPAFGSRPTLFSAAPLPPQGRAAHPAA